MVYFLEFSYCHADVCQVSQLIQPFFLDLVLFP